MQAITFLNRKTTLPGWVPTVHEQEPRSYAYRDGDFCVSIYGKNIGLYVQSANLTVSQKTADDVEP